MTERPEGGVAAVARWWVVAAIVVGSGLIAWRTTTIGTALELVAVLALLLGAGVAFGAVERRPRRTSGLLPPGRPDPDVRIASRAAATLASLDRIEHRRVEVGTPWPQLMVGPTGAIVVDLCPVSTRVEVDHSGVRDQGEGGGGRLCSRCQAALALADRVGAALASVGLEFPVRTVAVVGDDTHVVVRPDAPDDVFVVEIDRLADAVSRGPVLPMAQVDAAFEQLTRTVVSQRLPTP